MIKYKRPNKGLTKMAVMAGDRYTQVDYNIGY